MGNCSDCVSVAFKIDSPYQKHTHTHLCVVTWRRNHSGETHHTQTSLAGVFTNFLPENREYLSDCYILPKLGQIVPTFKLDELPNTITYKIQALIPAGPCAKGSTCQHVNVSTCILFSCLKAIAFEWRLRTPVLQDQQMLDVKRKH